MFSFFPPSLIVHLLQYIQWSASSYLPFLINCEDYDTCILMRTQFLNRYRGAEEPYGVVWHEEIRPPMLSVHCHQLGHLLCFCSGWTSVDSLPLPPQSNLLYLYETSLNRKPSYVGASLDTNELERPVEVVWLYSREFGILSNMKSKQVCLRL